MQCESLYIKAGYKNQIKHKPTLSSNASSSAAIVGWTKQYCLQRRLPSIESQPFAIVWSLSVFRKNTGLD